MAADLVPGGCDIGCSSCAFRAGSETRGEFANVVKATLCELGGVPFYCHYSKAGEDFHASKAKPPVQELRICEGWKARMQELKRDPQWTKRRRIRKAFAELALGALERLSGNENDEERRMALKTIERAIHALVLRPPRCTAKS